MKYLQKKLELFLEKWNQFFWRKLKILFIYYVNTEKPLWKWTN